MLLVLDRRKYYTPSPAEDAPVREGIDGGDARAKKDGGGNVVGSVRSDGGGGEGFYSGE